MSHDSNVTSNRFDFVKTPLALAVGMVFAPQVWADDGTNESFAGDPNGGSRTGIPDLQHVDAKSGSSAITYTAAGDNAGRLDISDNAEAVLSWESFDIGAGKALQILNSTSEYVLVNQVYNGATTIAGSIDSFGTAGTVVIINTSGVTISDGASIDAANLMISSSGMTNAGWVDGSLSNTGAANFGVTFDALADNGGSANIAINENLSVTGDLVVRAEGSVTIADTSNVGNVQATNIYISSDQGAVTASGNSTLNGTSTLTIDSAPGTTGGAINVKVAATELQAVDAGAAAVTLVAGGAITQKDGLNTKGGVITIKSDHMVGSSSNPIRVNGTSIDVYGITHDTQTGSNIATDNDIYIRATGSSLAVGVLNSDAGNVYISGDQAVSDGDSDTATLDVVGSTLVISSTGDTSALGTAVSNLQTIGSGSVTISNKADSANGDVAQTGAITLVSGSSTANDEAVSITTAAGNVTLGGAFDSGKSSNYSDLTIVTAASGELVTSAGSVKVKDFTVVADEIALSNTANQIEATGTIAIRAATSNRAINLGTGTNGLDLRASELLAFKAGATEMVIGADKDNGNKSTGTFTVSGENVESKNALDIFAADANLVTTTTATGLAITGTFSGPGGVTSGNDATADLVGGAITIDTAGSFGAGAATSIDVTATGVVSVAAGNASNDAADTIYLNSLGDLSLGALTTRNSVGDVNAGDTVSLVSAGDITDGNADAANITAGVVTIDVVAGEGVGTSANYIEVVGPDATNLNFQVAGSDSLTGARFAGLHVQTDDALTLQNDVYSTAGVTLRSGGALLNNSKNINDNASAAISLLGTAFTLSGSDLITTGGAVNLTDSSGAFAIANTAAITDYVADAVSALTLTSTGGDITLGSTGALDVSAVSESGFTVTSSGNVVVSNATTGAAAVTLQANAGAGKIYGTAGVTTTGALTLDAGQIDGTDGGGNFVVSSGTLLVDTGQATSQDQSITSAGAIDLRGLTTGGSGDVAITTTNNASTADHITIGADVDSNATGSLTLTSNDDVIIGGALDHAGALNVIAHGAENGTGTTGAGLLYSSADKIVTSGGALTLRGDVIGKTDDASDPLKVASTSLNLNAGASGNGAVNITSAAAIRLDTLDTTGSGTVAITTTAGNIQLGDGSGTAITNAGTGALTVTSAGNIDVTEAFTQTGDATLISATTGKIYGDSLLSATGALTLRADMIDNDGDSSDDDAVGSKELKVDSGTLNIDVDGASSANDIFVHSDDAIDLRSIASAGSRDIAISTGNSDTADHITIGADVDSNATGSLTLTSNDDVIIGGALDHAGALNVIAHGAENGTGTTGAGLLYSSADKIVTSGGALTLRGDVIGKTDDASDPLKVASTSLNLNAGASGNGAVNITSAAAIRLDTLDTTGSGTVAITTTAGNIQLGDGSGTAITNAGTGALTVTSAGNIDVTEAFTQTGDATLISATTGKIYGDSLLSATGALTLRADMIDNDGDSSDDDAVGSKELKVDSGTLNIDVDGASSANDIFVHSDDAIDLRSIASAGSRDIAISTGNSDTADHITIGADVDSNATGSLTLTSNDDVIIGGALDHAGALNVIAHGAEDGSGTTGAGLLYSSADKIVTSGGALTLRGDVIGKTDDASDPLKVASTSLNLNAGASGNGAVNITSAAAIRLDTLDTTGSGTVAITTTAGDITLGNGGNAIDNAGSGALTITSDEDVNVAENFGHGGAVTVAANGNGTLTGQIYSASSVLTSTGAMTLKADIIGDDDSATNAMKIVAGGDLVVDGDASTGNVKLSSTSAVTTGAVDVVNNTDGDFFLTTTGASSDITIGGAMDADEITITSGGDVDIQATVRAGDQTSADGNFIKIVANGGGSGIGSVLQTGDLSAGGGLAADEIDITARTVGSATQAIDIDLLNDNGSRVSLILGQVTGDTYVGLDENDTNVKLEYLATDTKAASVVKDTVSISFTKDVSQTAASVDETQFLDNTNGVDGLTLTAGNFSSTDLAQLTIAALNTRLIDVENNLGQGWSQSVNVANVVAYIINGADGVVGLDSKFNTNDTTSLLSLTEFKAGQDAAGSALTVGADLYNASVLLDGVAVYSDAGDGDYRDANEVKLRDLVSVGNTSVDTTIANLNTVFAATAASGLTGITSSGTANLNGGIAVDTNKFTVAANGTVATAGTITANEGIVVDTLTIDGSTIASSGDIILDAATDITLDADGEDIFLKDGTVLFATMTNNSNDLTIAVVGGDISFSDDNLTTTGLSNLDGGIAVDTNKFTVDGSGTGNMVVAGTSTLTGNTSVAGTLGVSGASTVAGITASGLANLDGGIAVDSDKFTVDGSGTGNTVVAGTSTLTGNTSVAGNLAVTGTSTLTGNTSVAGTLGVSGASTVAGITASGLANLDGGIAVDSDKFTVDGSGTGNTVVAGTSTLTGNTSVAGNLAVTGTSTLTGNTSVAGTLGVSGASTVAGITASGLANLDGGIAVDSDKFTVDGSGTGNTVVAGTSTLTGNTSVAGNLAVTGTSTLTGNTSVAGTLGVSGASTVAGITASGLANLDGGIAVDSDKFTVDGSGTGNTVVAGTSTLTGNTSVAGNLAVTGTSTLTGNTSVAGTLGVSGASTVAGITASGLANLDGGIAVDSDKFTVDGSGTGNTVVAGTSTLTGNTSVAGNLAVTGTSTLTGNTSVAGTLGVSGASTVAGITASGLANLDGGIAVDSDKFTVDGSGTGNTVVAGTSTLTGNTSVAGNLAVTGTSTLTGNTSVAGTLGVSGASTVAGITASGLANLDGGIAVDSDKFTVDGSGTGNMVVAGTSTLTGNTSVAGTLGVSGASTVAGITASGLANLDGGIAVDSDKFTVDGSGTGNTVVAGTSTLTGNTSVAGNLAVTGTSTLTGNTSVAGTLGVSGASTVAGITASGLANLDGGIAVDSDKFTVDGSGTGNMVVAGTSTLTGNTSVAGTLGVSGASTVAGITASGLANLDGGIAVDSDKFTVDGSGTGNTVVAGTSTLTGNTSVAGNLAVTGTSTLTGNTSVAGTLGVSGASTVAGITASGLANLDGGIAVDSDKFTVDGSGTGNTVVAGTSTLTGNTSVAGNLAVTGTSTLTGNTSVAGTLGVSGASTVAGITASGLANLDGGIAVDSDKFTVDGSGTGNTVVAGTSTLTGNTSVAGNLAVTGTSTLTGNTSVAGTLGVSGASTVAGITASGLANLDGGIAVDSDKFTVDGSGTGNTVVAGTSTLTGNTSVAGNLAVTGTSTLTGNTSVAGTLGVSGASTVAGITASGLANLDGGIAVDSDKFTVDGSGTGNTVVAGTSTLTGNTSVAGNLAVTGTSTLTGDTSVAGALDVDGASTVAGITASGSAALNGGITVDTDKFVVADGTGNVSVDGTLAVDGATDLNSTLSVDGASSVAALTASGAAALNGGITVATDKFTVSSAGNMVVAGTSTLATASATSLTATTADINGGTLDGVTMGTGQIGSVVTLVDANDTSRTLATLITTQAGNVAQTAVNVTDIAAVTDVASRADTKADAIAEFRDSSGAEADAADGSDIVAAATVLRAIDATAAKANSETLGTLEDEIDSLNADNAGGNSFLTFFRNLFGTTTAAGGG